MGGQTRFLWAMFFVGGMAVYGFIYNKEISAILNNPFSDYMRNICIA
jgi:hypothetical protein